LVLGGIWMHRRYKRRTGKAYGLMELKTGHPDSQSYPSKIKEIKSFSFCLQSCPASGAFLVNHWIARKFLFTFLVSIMPSISFSVLLIRASFSVECTAVSHLATGACSQLMCLCSSYSCHVLLGDHACPAVPHRLGSGGHMDAQTV